MSTSVSHYLRLLSLLPEHPTDVGQITAVGTDGCTVHLLSGDTTTARGVGAVGDWVYLKDGAIQGPAPVLSTAEIEV